MKALSPTARKVLSLVRRDGAVSTTRVVKEFDELDWPTAKKAIVELLSAGEVTWTGGLPNHYVFFVLPENGRKSAYGLMAKHGASQRGGGPRRASPRVTQVRDTILSYLRDEPDNPATIVNIVDDGSLGLSMGAVRRHLAALEAQGLVKQVPQKTGKRGRPWAGWLPVPKDEIPIVALGNDALTLRINDGAALSAMTDADRSRRGPR